MRSLPRSITHNHPHVRHITKSGKSANLATFLDIKSTRFHCVMERLSGLPFWIVTKYQENVESRGVLPTHWRYSKQR